MFENIKSKRSPIGIEFIKRGLLTENQVDRVLEYQKEHKEDNRQYIRQHGEDHGRKARVRHSHSDGNSFEEYSQKTHRGEQIDGAEG